MQFDANVKGTHWHICGKSQCSGGEVVYTVLRPVWFLAQFKWISILPKRKKNYSLVTCDYASGLVYIKRD